MNNRKKRHIAFSSSKSSIASGKEFARKAVEEDFRKRKKTKRGGYDSDEDVGENHGRKEYEDDYENNKKIKEDLVKQYRDRAKERREGSASIPHRRIKGLDKALIQKEREDIIKSADGETLTSPDATQAANITVDAAKHMRSINGVVDGTSNDTYHELTRNQLLNLEEAKLILRDFSSSNSRMDNTPIKNNDNNKSGNINDGAIGHEVESSVILSSGLVDYIKEAIQFKEDSDTNTFGNAILQRTIYSLTIDGHPSDSRRSWEIPRHYTLSGGNGRDSGSNSKGALLSDDVMNTIESVFESRNIIRKEMMNSKQQQEQKQEWVIVPSVGGITSKEHVNNIDHSTNETSRGVKQAGDDDDDMFGGLDD